MHRAKHMLRMGPTAGPCSARMLAMPYMHILPRVPGAMLLLLELNRTEMKLNKEIRAAGHATCSLMPCVSASAHVVATFAILNHAQLL